MKKQPQQDVLSVVWHEEEKTLTLDGEPVLHYCLAWPQVEQGGFGGRWINFFYRKLAKQWRTRWQREVYCSACLDLAQKRAHSRAFTPWQGSLTGEVTWLQDGLLSLRMQGEEVRGDRKPCRVRWGDTWRTRDGAPVSPKNIMQEKRGWKRKLNAQLLAVGADKKASGACFLSEGWEDTVKKSAPLRDFCLTEQGMEFAFGQCTLAPAAEGTPVFCVSQTVKEVD